LSAFDDAIAGAMDTARSVAGRSVGFRRPSSGQSVQIVAVVGETRFEAGELYGDIVLAQKRRDYIVAAEDLKLGGEQVRPEAGDEIVEVRDGVRHVYELMDLGTEKHYRELADGRHLRLHVKYVGTEP